MADELLSLRVIVVRQSPGDCDMFRKAAAAARVPIELVEHDGEAAAVRSIAAGADLAFFDLALGSEAVARMTGAAHALANPPFTVSLCAADEPLEHVPEKWKPVFRKGHATEQESGAHPDSIESGCALAFATDALASMPVEEDDAQRLLSGSIRLRLPSRVLLVDDSSTMRSIVRKVLAATRFPLIITEADEGGQALALARAAEFDMIFFDHNMPRLSGLQAIAELRRAKRYSAFVLMTSADDEALAEKAHAQGIAFLKKPFFPADLERVLCRFCGLRALNPARQ